jgi:hypothetical protein
MGRQISAFLAAGLWATLCVPAVHAARECSAAGIAGRYGYTISGTVTGIGPITTVGSFVLDAAGNISGAQTASFNGAIVPETFSGTATINPDCTGTSTVNVFHGTTLARTDHFFDVVDDSQSEIRAIFLTPGFTVTLTAKKDFPGEGNQD